MPPKAKGKAKAKVGPMRRGALRRPAGALDGGGGPGLRRPAGAEPPGRDGVALQWDQGHAVDIHQLDLGKLTEAGPLVIEEGTYFHQPCKAAGECLGVSLEEGRSYLRLQLTGTLCEGLLKHYTGNPKGEVRGHICPSTCNGEEAADNLVHVRKVRKRQSAEQEGAWVENLMKAVPAREGEDELAALRRQMPALEPRRNDGEGLGGAPAPAEKEKQDRGRDGKEDSKKAKKKEKKKKKKRKKSEEDSEEGSGDKALLDGTQPKRACVKETQALFMGTGLDAREKIRNKVTRRGRRHLSKKSNKDTSSSSGSGSSSNSRSGTEGVEENLFDPSSKVRILAEQFPGALTNQGINHMRTSLLQEIGHQDRPNALHPVAVAYTRQHLLRRASAPVQRELLTLSHALDLMLKGKASAAADTLMQRLKSIEQTLLGSHWSISQKLEVLPPESASITALPEAKSAQREMYDESRLRWLATSPDGRQGQKGGKSGGKTKGEGKEGRGQEREGKGGKKSNPKGDQGKKKES